MHRRKVSLIFITRHSSFIFCPQTNIPHTYVYSSFIQGNEYRLLSKSSKFAFVTHESAISKRFYRLRVKFGCFRHCGSNLNIMVTIKGNGKEMICVLFGKR